ncbi:MAG: M6 family metalloprotease domain-containing protein [Caldilineaceae bacterium]
MSHPPKLYHSLLQAFLLFTVFIVMLFLVMMMAPMATQRQHRYRVMAPPPVKPEVWASSIQEYDLNPLSIGEPMPQTGDQKLLILLVDFVDQPGLFSGQQWRDSFFGAAGFAAYFAETSYGQLRYAGDIVGMAGGAPAVNTQSVSYVRLPHPITFYADALYGFKTGAHQFPRNNAGVVTHALQALDNAGFDFAPYANPTTQQVENLLIIFGGRPHVYTRDPINSLEATGYSLAAAGAPVFVSSGGQTFDNFTFCPDQEGSNPGALAHIGICVHEHGHSLGLPDLYDFSYLTSGVGRYDVMSYGAYGVTSGVRPFHFGAFSKEFLGWVQPTLVQSDTTVIALGPAETEPAIVKLVPNGRLDSAEYFLLENRQPIGFDRDWISGGYCPGLYIWRVDQNVVDQFSWSNLVNSPLTPYGPQHPGVMIVEADGGNNLIHPPFTYGECSDAWPTAQMWNSTSLPSTRLWNNADSGISLTVQSAHDNMITLTIELDNVAPVGATPTPVATSTPTLGTTPTASATPTSISTPTQTPTPSVTPVAIITATESQTETPMATPSSETPGPVIVTSTPVTTPTGLSPKPSRLYLPIAHE